MVYKVSPKKGVMTEIEWMEMKQLQQLETLNLLTHRLPSNYSLFLLIKKLRGAEA